MAQLNIGRIAAPLDSELTAGFVNELEPINAIADAAPGFVWRLQTEDGDATAIRALDDDMLLVSMSVWESVEALAQFTYSAEHREILRGRRQWFEKMTEAIFVLWWVPAGSIPTVEEAKGRLTTLRERGPSPEAFTFRLAFPPPGAPAGDVPASEDDWLCAT